MRSDLQYVRSAVTGRALLPARSGDSVKLQIWRCGEARSDLVLLNRRLNEMEDRRPSLWQIVDEKKSDLKSHGQRETMVVCLISATSNDDSFD